MRKESEFDAALKYVALLHKSLVRTEVTLNFDFPVLLQRKISLNDGVNVLIDVLKKQIIDLDKKIMIVGNGGSAAIAIHMIMDYVHAGKMRTIDFMSPSLLTCMANDYSYEHVFAEPIKIFSHPGDILFCISSSGKSANILKACETAKYKKCLIATFSGFDMNNPLRKLGNINFYVPSSRFGFVEIAHETLLHCILDLFIKKAKTCGE